MNDSNKPVKKKIERVFIDASRLGGCQCYLCADYAVEKVSDIISCKCYCHEADGRTGHDRLCCPYPNALTKTLLKESPKLKGDIDES